MTGITIKQLLDSLNAYHSDIKEIEIVDIHELIYDNYSISDIHEVIKEYGEYKVHDYRAYIDEDSHNLVLSISYFG